MSFRFRYSTLFRIETNLNLFKFHIIKKPSKSNLILWLGNKL